VGSQAFDLGARPVRRHVAGAPYQPGQLVRVERSCDEQGDASGVRELVGRFGVVKYLEYSCGSGQHYPDDPMVGVRFRDGGVRELWKDELSSVGVVGS
jgi:hypothetical protein